MQSIYRIQRDPDRASMRWQADCLCGQGISVLRISIDRTNSVSNPPTYSSWIDAPIYLPWTDPAGNYPAWLQAYWTLVEEIDRRPRVASESPLQRLSEQSLPRLSFLVRCLNGIRNEPTLMGKLKDLARNHPNPETIKDGETSDLANLIGAYIRWIELSAGEESLGVAQSHLFTIIYNIERGRMYANDADAIRTEVLSSFFVDDLPKRAERG